MSETTFFPSPAQRSRLAGVYKANEAKDALVRGSYTQFLDPFNPSPRYPAPGGGLFSTAADVTKFAQIPHASMIYSVFGLIVFAGFTVIDFQRLRRSRQNASAQLIAASIFLDILNVFLFFLSIFGGGGRRN